MLVKLLSVEGLVGGFTEPFILLTLFKEHLWYELDIEAWVDQTLNQLPTIIVMFCIAYHLGSKRAYGLGEGTNSTCTFGPNLEMHFQIGLSWSALRKNDGLNMDKI